MITQLTCIECPMGCQIDVETAEDGKVVSVKGNTCPRGKMYAESEVTCPMRVVTSTVRLTDGRVLPVKTDKPVRKSEMSAVMKKINAARPSAPLAIGDIIINNIDGDANLVATDEAN